MAWTTKEVVLREDLKQRLGEPARKQDKEIRSFAAWCARYKEL